MFRGVRRSITIVRGIQDSGLSLCLEIYQGQDNNCVRGIQRSRLSLCLGEFKGQDYHCV